MKNLSIVFVVVVFIGAVFYMLYTKGLILANFESVSPKTAYEIITNDKNMTLLDVRTQEEYTHDGHIAGAMLIPVDQLAKKLHLLDKSKKILVYCRSGHRSTHAARILEKAGYVVINLKGGINSWKAEKLPVK